jgi:IclR family acetate operon transcriptional repressor
LNDINIKSAQRVLEIIECFGAKRQPLRLKHVVEELKYPSSSVAVLLKCMTQLGYLNFDELTHSYSLTGRLAGLTNWVAADSFENGIVDEILRSLQKSCGELILLAAESGLHSEYIKTYRSLGDGIQLYISPGTKRVLILCGAGWLFLSKRSEQEVAEIYRKTIKAGYLKEVEFPMSRLMERLACIRDEDVIYATARESIRPVAHWGGSLISMEIPVPAGHGKLAICIGGPAERLKEKFEKIAKILRASRAKITESLKKDVLFAGPEE